MIYRRGFMAIMEISVVPIGTKDTSLSSYVADCIRVLKEEKVPTNCRPWARMWRVISRG